MRPYRETADQIAAAQIDGAVCVEMEAAALYAYATARDRPVVCLAHVTHTWRPRDRTSRRARRTACTPPLAVAGAVAHVLD